MWLFCFCRWEAAATANDGWYQRHPVIHAKPAHLRVPLGIHGDDAGVHGSNQVLVLIWGGVASKLLIVKLGLLLKGIVQGHVGQNGFWKKVKLRLHNMKNIPSQHLRTC